MTENESDKENSSLLELTRYLGPRWKPISVETQRYKEGVNVLKQTITLSYVKMDKSSEDDENLKKNSNLQVRVFNGDR